MRLVVSMSAFWGHGGGPMACCDDKWNVLAVALELVRVPQGFAKMSLRWSCTDRQRDGEQNDGQGPSAQ